MRREEERTSWVERARRLYEPLNGDPSSRRYLTLWDRDIAFSVRGNGILHLHVENGHLRVEDGPPRQIERTVLEVDPAVLAALLDGRTGFAATGAGRREEKLRVIEGHGFMPDLSWIGILTRLAQERLAGRSRGA